MSSGTDATAPLRTIVTGAANGIGAAVAARLRDRGDAVVGIDREAADGVVVGDLADPASREAAVAEATGRLGGVDVLVCVAGVFRPGSIVDSTFDDWRPVWAVNLDAPLDLMRLVAPGMVVQGFGRIVAVTSVHATHAGPDSLAYDVSKAGLEAGIRSVALDLGRHGVLANAVAPGYVRTRMSLLPDGRDETDTDEFRATYVDGGRLPLGRAALPHELGPAVDLLTARDNTYLTGQTLVVDGGITITY